MTLAPWRSPLARAIHKNRSLANSRYVQLATVTPDGRPANRTIVFRGFTPDSNNLQFITDCRSQKIGEINHQPMGEVCWYFPKSREQFRIGGTLCLIDCFCPDPALLRIREQLWRGISDNARMQFVWPHPKQLRDDQSLDSFSPTPPDRSHPIDNFCALLLEPTQVDHLQLRGNPQTRHYYELLQGQWIQQEVNP